MSDTSNNKPVAKGTILIPRNTTSIVLFTDGRKSNRFHQINQTIADELNNSGIATILFDLLTDKEKRIDRLTKKFKGNIGFLTQRLITATDWLRKNDQTKDLSIGYFGVDEEAAAALAAAAIEHREIIKAIVCLSGRPDLSASALSRLESPTLFIVGENDHDTLKLTRRAMEKIKVENTLMTISSASHFFEEPEKVRDASRLAKEWFLKRLK